MNAFQKSLYLNNLSRKAKLRISHIDFNDPDAVVIDNFSLPSAGDIWGNITAGIDNIKMALSGNPIDALTQSAIQAATQQAEQQKGSPLTLAEKNEIQKQVTVTTVQTGVEKNLTGFFSGLGKYILLALVALFLLNKLIK